MNSDGSSIVLVVILIIMIFFSIGINKDIDKIKETLSLLEQNINEEEYIPINTYGYYLESEGHLPEWYYEDGNKNKDKLSIGYLSIIDGYSIGGSRFIDESKLLFKEEEDYLYKISEAIYVLLSDQTGNNIYIVDENDVNLHHFVRESFIEDNPKNEDEQSSNKVEENKHPYEGRYNLFDNENRIIKCISIEYSEEKNSIHVVFFSHREGEKVYKNGVITSIKGVIDDNYRMKKFIPVLF